MSNKSNEHIPIPKRVIFVWDEETGDNLLSAKCIAFGLTPDLRMILFTKDDDSLVHKATIHVDAEYIECS